MRQIWIALVGMLMIVLSLVIQAGVFLIVGGIAIPSALDLAGYRIPKGSDAPGWIIAGLFVLYNGVTMFDYFRRKRVISRCTSVEDAVRVWQKGIGADDLAMALFLVPRGLDRLFSGSEISMRLAE